MCNHFHWHLLLYSLEMVLQAIWRITVFFYKYINYNFALGILKVLLLIQFSFAKDTFNRCQEADTIVWNIVGRHFRKKRNFKRAFILMAVIIITAS